MLYKLSMRPAGNRSQRTKTPLQGSEETEAIVCSESIRLAGRWADKVVIFELGSQSYWMVYFDIKNLMSSI
jgi:hypothetical protein